MPAGENHPAYVGSFSKSKKRPSGVLVLTNQEDDTSDWLRWTSANYESRVLTVLSVGIISKLHTFTIATKPLMEGAWFYNP